MKKKIGGFVALGLATIATLGLTGCSNTYSKNVDKLEENVKTAIQTIDDIDLKGTVKNYNFLNVDVEQQESDYKLDVSGLVRYEETTSTSLLGLTYIVPTSYFDGIKMSSDDQLVKSVAQVVVDYQPTNVNFLNLESYKALNKAMSNISKDSVDKKFHKNMIYGVSNITFEDGKVSFNAHSAIVFSTTHTRTTTVYNGRTIVPIVSTYKNFHHYDETANISLSVTNEQISQMKQDNSLILDTFVSYMEDSKDKVMVNKCEVNKYQEQDTSNVDSANLEM